jgi:hypothetical protein
MLIMIGTAKDDVDPEKMMSAELHAHFTRLLVGVHKMWTHAWVMLIPSFLIRWIRLLALRHLSMPSLMPSSRKSWPICHHSHSRATTCSPRSSHTTTCGYHYSCGRLAAAAAITEAATHDGYATDEGENKFEDENKLEEDKVQQPRPGHPWQYNWNARQPPRPVRDDEHVAKLK